MRVPWWTVFVLAGLGASASSCLAKSRQAEGTGGGDAGQGGDAGAGGEAGAAGEAGDSAAAQCEGCMGPQVSAAGPCEPMLVQCHYDAACSGWLECYGVCALADWSASCLATCHTAHPSAEGLVYGLLACACAECSAEPTCAPACQ